MTWLFVARPRVLLGTEITNFLYSNSVHAFCINMLTTCSLVLKGITQTSYSTVHRRARPKHNFFFLPFALRVETFGCQQLLTTGRSLKLIRSAIEEEETVGWTSVYAFSAEISVCKARKRTLKNTVILYSRDKANG